MSSYADLHIHTAYSDGRFYPKEIFEKAEKAGLAAISITDHDTLDGCIEAQEIKKNYKVDFINGLEFSCIEEGKEYHILGYDL
ncbi:MAG TPA: PHP domain-containing protein, partial [Ignavibacteriales bacterium]|nr:PHP domain-containing protein [Ignavibacteriales bacterium]